MLYTCTYYLCIIYVWYILYTCNVYLCSVIMHITLHNYLKKNENCNLPDQDS